MNVDHFLKMGTSHKICEDYIISGYNPVPFVILSDGCSSSKNTDIGARILTHLAKQYLKNEVNNLYYLNIDKMKNWIIYNAESIIKSMGLEDKSCLDATLIISYSINDYMYVYMFGDGFLITVDLNNEIYFYEISYKNNAPYYLSYQIDTYTDSLYAKSDPEKSLLNKFGRCNLEPFDSPFVRKLKALNYKGIFIASDGLSSFINEKGEKYNIEKVLKEVTSFKNSNGEFIKRRMGSKKGVINTLKEKGITHYDDISIGGFFFKGN